MKKIIIVLLSIFILLTTCFGDAYDYLNQSRTFTDDDSKPAIMEKTTGEDLDIYCPEDFKHKKDRRWFSLIPYGGGRSYGYYKDYSTFVGMPCSITGITKKDNSDLYILEVTICRLLNESAETLYPLTFKYEVAPGTKLKFGYILSNLKHCGIEILDVKSNYIKYQTEDPAWYYY